MTFDDALVLSWNKLFEILMENNKMDSNAQFILNHNDGFYEHIQVRDTFLRVLMGEYKSKVWIVLNLDNSYMNVTCTD